MDFGTLFQLRTKRYWWMDVIFYFAISLLVASAFCLFVFMAKNAFWREGIKSIEKQLETVGTERQRAEEGSVIGYQKKINDFSELFKNHQFASYVFVFMQSQTMPNIWFKQFALNRQNAQVNLTGEADNLEALSRQVANFEKNKYIKNLGALSSTLSESGKIIFSFNVVLDPKLFSADSEMSALARAKAEEAKELPLPPESPEEEGQEVGASQKLITSFHLKLEPEVIGVVDQKNYTIKIDVPYGTDLSSIMPSVIVSPGATIIPPADALQNFSGPVIYTVVADDGSTQDYRVETNVLPKSGQTTESRTASPAGMVIVIFVAAVLIAGGVIFFFAWKKIQKNKSTPYAN